MQIYKYSFLDQQELDLGNRGHFRDTDRNRVEKQPCMRGGKMGKILAVLLLAVLPVTAATITVGSPQISSSDPWCGS
jgi:hypothetical protein